MSKKNSLPLDLFDKESIKTATVDLAKMIEERKRELVELEQKYAQLRIWAGYAAGQKKTPAAGQVSEREPSTQAEAVRILNETKRPMNTMEIVVHMGSGANPKTVNWALWNAERAGLIQRIPKRKGIYAALDYEPSENGDGARIEAEHPLSRDSASTARP